MKHIGSDIEFELDLFSETFSLTLHIFISQKYFVYNEIIIMNKVGEHLDIKHMKYFMEVVNQGGMTNASKSLYIAQPTISKAIKDIENELKMTLFDRQSVTSYSLMRVKYSIKSVRKS